MRTNAVCLLNKAGLGVKCVTDDGSCGNFAQCDDGDKNVRIGFSHFLPN